MNHKKLQMKAVRKVIYKKPKPHNLIMHPFFLIFLSFLGGVIISFFVSQDFINKIAERQPLENSKNEMKKIPEDVKKAMINHEIAPTPSEKTASISGTIRVPILMYHYVEIVTDKRDTKRQSLDILPSVFDTQMATLKNAGYTFLTAAQLGEIMDGKMKLPDKPVLITFDDGHWDLDTDILPILKKYQIHATAYIIPGFIGGSDFLSSKQLQDVIDSKLVEIGAHTVHHVYLKGRTLATDQFEVNTSKQMLEQQYHLKIVSFAYPYGAFDLQAISVVKAAGFSTAVSTIPGIMQDQQNRFFLYRLRPGGRTGQYLLNFLQQSTFPAY